MSDVLLLYLFTRLDVLPHLGFGMLVFGGFVAAAFLFHGLEDSNSNSVRMGKRLLLVPSLGLVLLVAIPTKADMAIILGGKIALDADRSDTAKEVGSEVLAAIRAQLRRAAE